MKEFRAIVDAFDLIDLKEKKAAVATVVKVRGSSYRSPGARMLITDDGKWVGSISGGCLEGDALRKARQVMTDNQPVTVTYDTREESNQNLGIGLGCNGVIDVIIEPISADQNTIGLFRTMAASKMPYALATVFRSEKHIGQKLLLNTNGDFLQTIDDEKLNAAIREELSLRFSIRKSEVKTFVHEGEEVEIFMELIEPSIELFIFGAGFDARPVSQMAKSLGWNVSVTDECVAHIAPVFFPSASKLSLCHRDFIDRDFDISPYTACVLMSHNYEYDRDVLLKLLRSPAPYIGILGPRKRFDKMRTEFEKNGVKLSADDLNRIHSPIGLDIGAETPDEIALSIVSEIQSKFANRSGGFLKYRGAPIHQRDQKTDQIFKQIYLNTDADNKSAIR
jgi:xanthine dehydrogenase accessory factor